MMTATQELIDGYLIRLEPAARTLPEDRRTELLTKIREHTGTPDETAVCDVLDRLGDPEEIAREAGGAPSNLGHLSSRVAAHSKIVVVLLLLLGSIVVPFVGWVVRAVLLWASTRWTLRQADQDPWSGPEAWASRSSSCSSRRVRRSADRSLRECRPAPSTARPSVCQPCRCRTNPGLAHIT
jgi:hypothetical protein